LKVLQLIIDAGADVNIQNCEGNTPLHYVIGKTGFVNLAEIKERVKLLIDNGGNASIKNNHGESAYDWSKKMFNHKTSTPLQRRLREEIIGLCKPNLLSIQVVAPKLSLIHEAVRELAKSRTKLEKSKTESEKKENQANLEQDLANLEQAVQENLLTINDLDHSGNTPIFNAVSLRNMDSVNVLLDKGADLNKRSNNNQTILHPLVKPDPKAINTSKKVNTSLFEELCSKVTQETINGQDAISGATPMHYAAAFNNELLKILIQYNADVNIQDKQGNTPLHYAIEKYKKGLSEDQKREVLAAVGLLCNNGANVTLKNKEGKTPLALAEAFNNKLASELLKAVAKHGGRVNG